MFRICVVLYLVAASQQISITELSVPDVVKVGDSAELKCLYDAGGPEVNHSFYVKWWRTPLGAYEDGRQQIYQRIAGFPPHASQDIEIKPNDTIVLKDLQPKHSGAYQCEVSNIIDEKKLADNLFVYTPDVVPVLNISSFEDGPDEGTEADTVVTCVAYDVAPEPKIDIYINDVIADIDTELSDPIDGFYDILVNATVGPDTPSGAVVKCTLTFVEAVLDDVSYTVQDTYIKSGDALVTTEGAAHDMTWETTTDYRQVTGSAALAPRPWKIVVGLTALLWFLAQH